MAIFHCYVSSPEGKKSISIIPSNPATRAVFSPPDVNFHQELADGGPSVHGLGAREIFVFGFVHRVFGPWTLGKIKKEKHIKYVTIDVTSTLR